MLNSDTHKDKAIIAALDLPGQQADLEELAALVDAAGAEVVGEVIQSRPKPDPATYFGSGKVEEIATLATATDASMLIVDSELAPSQIRNLEDQTELHVLDRSQLIIDIFAQRARTYEGRLQVEIAQLAYALPRLTGRGTEMSRLGGGIGTRGPGESKLEYDRRRIRERMRELRKEVDEIKRHRDLLRANRVRRGHPLVCLVGYTNAGKSTLLNALTDAEIFAADMLFATLDPTTRVLALPDGQEVAITDTVGFISRLPHMLVDAFHATLEEVQESDLLLHVVDTANEQFPEQMNSVQTVLEELKASDKKQIVVFNKADLLPDPTQFLPPFSDHPQIIVSAHTGAGLAELKQLIADQLPDAPQRVTYLLPHSRGEVVSWLHRQGEVVAQEYEAEGVRVVVDLRYAQIRQAAKQFDVLPAEGVLEINNAE
ncbi:MAG TPA: GTPase HflX [Firmicutes bacterium]|nr:GTPase HflX [Bacillota bacterium]